MFSDNIQNFSANPYRRVDLTALISHTVDPHEAIQLLKDRVAAIPNVLQTPAPDIDMLELTPTGPRLCVRPYCHNRSYWQVYFDTNRLIRDAFGEAGLPIPISAYNVTDVATVPPFGSPAVPRRARRLTRNVYSVCTLIALLVPVTPLQAQSTPEPPPPPQEATAEFSYVGTSGNASTAALGLGGEYIARQAPWMFRGKAAYVRNASEEELRAESVVALSRISRTLTDRVLAFGGYNFLHDRFAGTESRHVVEGGITFVVVRPKPHQVEVDAAIGYANENRVAGNDISAAQALTGARYKVAVSDTAEFSDEVLLAASLADSADWRTSNAASLTVRVTRIISLKVSNLLRYVNAPAEGFTTTDLLTSLAFVLKF